MTQQPTDDEEWTWSERFAVAFIAGAIVLGFWHAHTHDVNANKCQAKANQIHDTGQWIAATEECHK